MSHLENFCNLPDCDLAQTVFGAIWLIIWDLDQQDSSQKKKNLKIKENNPNTRTIIIQISKLYKIKNLAIIKLPKIILKTKKNIV
jgi:hypothetical protein